ncbi:hypothetical protein HBI70_204760 [Parastagonospora nodorum]|nr:hypothetical protein HBH53_189390 [Parastagonospora nodorum]KAH3962321.1 hypothetical protein HBH51_176400 [Parastagonospora nodorum]KAH5085524.1 hypothetical protein HBH95_018600 [Parastagonospora nodorum]KAH5145335.1 hypothetical protein HBH69_184780 [Parastagonospora nodorum]KAH5251874.1 hypothetical protein HBI70_204760 [Parastagonospora nodorum]
MLGSVLLPSQPPVGGLRRATTHTHTQSSGIAPPLPPRRNSLSTAPAAQTQKLQLRVSTLPNDSKPAVMESRYKRSSSPRRHANPARSSTGTFADPYYDYSSSSSYVRPSSPRSSADRIGGAHHHSTYYTPTTSITTGSRATPSTTYGRPRRNTNDNMIRPTASTTSMPLRTPYSPHSSFDRPSSPLTRSHDKRAETTYITQPARTSHKKIYSVDDTSRSTQLVAERDTIESSRHSKRDSMDRGYGVTSGGRTYHTTTKQPPARLTDLGDEGYSYTDPASMYRDTEPAWRRPRAGSMERTSRPTSMIIDRPARTSTRELGPPPSVRGFDKINNSIPRPHARSSSIDRSREIPKYEPYPDAAPSRSSSTRHHAPAIHQEPARDVRRDPYHETYDRRDVENRRHTTDHLPDPQVASRGFGIAPVVAPVLAHDYHVPNHQPAYPQEPVHTRADNYDAPYHSSHRASTHMPDPRIPVVDTRVPDPRASEPRVARPREAAPPATYDNYEKRPRERERESGSGFGSAVAGAATGVAATLGAANYMKNRDKDREERSSSEERERELERERRRAHDERDSRDKVDERRERRSDERERERERRPEERREVPAIPPAYPPRPDAEPKPRELRYEDEQREKPSRKNGSSEGSGDERPRHYVDRDAERRREAAPKEAAIDPDEDYRRRVQQEAERSSRSTRDRDEETDRERRRRKDGRDSSRSPEERSRASPPTRDGPSSRPDERSGSIYDANMVQEPESFDKLQADQPNKSVTIVTPPKDPQPAVKGILRKPTEKFPEEPEPIREGVAPHKDALKGKDIPIGARWTRIDRRLVNPQALEEAKERFEERMDCVIVLRVLTKAEIQKLADRTKKIRERREDEYDEHDKDDRDKRSHHSSRDDRDDDDRDRGQGRERRSRRYEDEESEYSDLDRERERERERPKMLEPAR